MEAKLLMATACATLVVIVCRWPEGVPVPSKVMAILLPAAALAEKKTCTLILCGPTASGMLKPGTSSKVVLFVVSATPKTLASMSWPRLTTETLVAAVATKVAASFTPRVSGVPPWTVMPPTLEMVTALVV